MEITDCAGAYDYTDTAAQIEFAVGMAKGTVNTRDCQQGVNPQQRTVERVAVVQYDALRAITRQRHRRATDALNGFFHALVQPGCHWQDGKLVAKSNGKVFQGHRAVLIRDDAQIIERAEI